MEVLNVSMRRKDKMKDDIISSLSDRLLVLSERMEALETKNSYNLGKWKNNNKNFVPFG